MRTCDMGEHTRGETQVGKCFFVLCRTSTHRGVLRGGSYSCTVDILPVYHFPPPLWSLSKESLSVITVIIVTSQSYTIHRCKICTMTCDLQLLQFQSQSAAIVLKTQHEIVFNPHYPAVSQLHWITSCLLPESPSFGRGHPHQRWPIASLSSPRCPESSKKTLMFCIWRWDFQARTQPSRSTLLCRRFFLTLMLCPLLLSSAYPSETPNPSSLLVWRWREGKLFLFILGLIPSLSSFYSESTKSLFSAYSKVQSCKKTKEI